MPDYEAMYFKLFNRVSDAIETLKSAQQELEEDYISGEGENESEASPAHGQE